MKINLTHLRERSTFGGWIKFAVFDAKFTTGTNANNATLLAKLTVKVRAFSLKVDQSALAFSQAGRNRFYGDGNLVDFLSRNGILR